MGGTGFSVTIEMMPNESLAAGAKRSEPRELHRTLWNSLSAMIFDTCRRQANNIVLNEYLGDCGYEGLDSEHADNPWSSTDTSFEFWFRDPGGCCGLSSEAASHWAQMALARRVPYLAAHPDATGYRIVGYPSARALLRRGPAWPLVEVKRTLYCVPRFKRGLLDYEEPGMGLFTNDGGKRPELNTLSPKDREAVVRVGVTGQCACEMCAATRKRTKPAKPTAKRGVVVQTPPAGDINHIPAAWVCLAQDEEATHLAKAACRELKAFTEEHWQATPLGPRELQVLRDWLEERNILPPHDDLVGMVSSFS